MQKNSVNKVMLIGHLGRDPEVRYTPGGDAVADISIATSESYKNREGNIVEKTEWHNLVVWRNTAEFAKQYLKKGSMVYVSGKLRTKSWEGQDGVKKYKTEVNVDELVALGGLGKKESSPQGAPVKKTPKKGDGDEEIPF